MALQLRRWSSILNPPASAAANRRAGPATARPNSGPVAQLATNLKWTSQSATVAKKGKLGPVTENVGHTAHADIDPADEIPGHETSSTEYKELYDLLKATYNETFIRGHLMNADFGGSNVAANLFPITSKANSLHKSNVENHVKGWMKDANTAEISYDVTANMGTNTVEDATFDCVATRKNTKGKIDKRIDRTITSSPQKKTKGVRDYGAADTEAWSYPGITNVWKWITGTQWIHGGPLGKNAREDIDALGSPLYRDSTSKKNYGYK